MLSFDEGSDDHSLAEEKTLRQLRRVPVRVQELASRNNLWRAARPSNDRCEIQGAAQKSRPKHDASTPGHAIGSDSPTLKEAGVRPEPAICFLV